MQGAHNSYKSMADEVVSARRLFVRRHVPLDTDALRELPRFIAPTVINWQRLKYIKQN